MDPGSRVLSPWSLVLLLSACGEAEHQSRKCVWGGTKLLMVARKSKEDRKGLVSTCLSGAQTSDLSSPQDLVFY